MSDLSRILPAGKLPLPLLEKLLSCFAPQDPHIIVGPHIGEDAAVLDFHRAALANEEHYLIAKSDPITFATDEIGWYAVNVNANDIAVMGGRPRWFLATVLLPAGRATGALAERIFAQLHDACAALSVSLVGGHTEITVGLERAIVAGTMLGEVAPDRLVVKTGSMPGDAVILIKSVPIEGTALIAREREGVLRQRGYEEGFITRAQTLLHDPGISVVAPARLAVETARVHAMHDPTEGGVITGLLEIARAAGLGMAVALDAIPVLPEGVTLCREFGLDPLGVIASGSLLLTAAEQDAPRLLESLAGAGYQACVIGRMTQAEGGLVALRDGRPVPWPVFPADEITKIF